MFQSPGVPQGHASSPPESRHDGLVKSFENQKLIAEEIAVRTSASCVHCPAFLKPPCHAEENVTAQVVSPSGYLPY